MITSTLKRLYVVALFIILLPLHQSLSIDFLDPEEGSYLACEADSEDVPAGMALKSTYDVICSDYKYLSLIHGAIAWESGFIRRLYDYGDPGEIKEIPPPHKYYVSFEKRRATEYSTEVVLKTVEEYLAGGHATVRLVHALFHRIPESQEESCFGVTKEITLQDQAIIEIIAKILFQFTRLRDYIKKIGPVRANLSSFKTITADLTNLLTEDALKKLIFVDEIAHNFVPKQKTLLPRDVTDEYYGNEETNVQANKNAPRDWFIQQVVSASFQESKPHPYKDFQKVSKHNRATLEPSPPYMPYTTEMIFLAFIYKKFGHSRKHIKSFYEKLNTLFPSDESFLVTPAKAKNIIERLLDMCGFGWARFLQLLQARQKGKKFDKQGGIIPSERSSSRHEKTQTIKKKITTSSQKITTLPPRWQDKHYRALTPDQAAEKLKTLLLHKNLDQHYEDIVFYSTQLYRYPKPNGYRTLPYLVNPGATEEKKEYDTLSDYMDNAIRNLIRLYAYNPTTHRLEVNQLEKYGFKPHENLRSFLERHSNPYNDDSPEAHRDWMHNVTSNIDYVFYQKETADNCVQNLTTNQYAFLKIPTSPQLIQIILNGDWIKKNNISVTYSTAFCMQPSMRNFIVILDHLLGLGLYENKALGEVFGKDNFIKTYLGLLVQRLACKNLKDVPSISDEYDKEGFHPLKFLRTSEINLPNKFSYTLVTSPQHGELHVTIATTTPDLPQGTKIDFANCQSLSLMLTHLLNQSTISRFDFLQEIKHTFMLGSEQTTVKETGIEYNCLFALPLESENAPDKLSEILTKLYKNDIPKHMQALLSRIKQKNEQTPQTETK